MKTGMRPALQAFTHFGSKFDETVAWYLLNGYFYSGPELFVLACKHSRDALIENREINKLDNLDCWYIQYVSGEIKRLFDLIPEEKEWVVFERWGRTDRKAFKFDRIKQRICYGITRHTEST